MLRRLAPVFLGLVAWKSALAQKPSESEAAAVIEKGHQKALDYAHSLPDFLCTEVVHRFAAVPVSIPQRAFPQSPVQSFKWVATDKLTIKLSYFQQTEQHKLVMINDKATDDTYENLAGAVGGGEFGGTLRSIFDPASETAFHWEKWKTVRKHRVAAFNYEVSPAHSSYVLGTGRPNSSHEAVVGFHGVLEIDSDTGEVLHLTYVAGTIPSDLNLEYAVTTVDYDLADVGGRSYLLPAHSETEMRGSGHSARNEMEFREYRKFDAASKVEFGIAK